MTRCTVRDNHATDQVQGNAGGIFTAWTTTLTDCLIEANRAGSLGGGLLVNGGTTTLKGTTTVQRNHADATAFSSGGGLYVTNGGTVSIEETCRVTQNTASAGGGGIIAGGGGIFRDFAGRVTLLGADPSPIVVDNCPDNCLPTSSVPKCSAVPPAGPCP
jgi:hypothetical protein